MDLNELIESLHPLEVKVVPHLKDGLSMQELEHLTGLKDVEIMRALQWLENKKVLTLTTKNKDFIDLDTQGKLYQKEGLPEKRFLQSISGSEPLGVIGKKAKLDKNELNVCIGVLKKKAAIQFDAQKNITLTDQGEKLLEKPSLEEAFLTRDFPITQNSLKPEDQFVVDTFLKRKGIIKKITTKTRTLTLSSLGKDLVKKGVNATDRIERLTPEHLKTGQWKKGTFRRYDVSINVPPIHGGKIHFVSQALEHIRSIWLELGFSEQTGPHVQTAFWDLDALFVPQDHPARTEQDTFYIKNPSHGKLPKLKSAIKDVHEHGGKTGSRGWGSVWSEDIAKENLLITHDTYLSAQVLAHIKKEELPVKTFQIMKVFRNEALDWKHLFEFYQVGGIVVGEEANFTHLLGYLKLFFSKMGYDDVRIRPAHFPYTEPSAEIEVLHPKRKEWVELGGSGIFRPELVQPLLGEDIPVLAWGFGMARIISDYWDISDIRELYKNDIAQLREQKYYIQCQR